MSLLQLKMGFKAFQKQNQKHKKLLAKTLVITCVDARCDPGILFQTKLNELIVVRNIANIVPPYGARDAIATTLEFGVKIQRVSDIVILGHSDCGGIKLFCNGTAEPLLNDYLKALKVEKNEDYDLVAKDALLASYQHCIAYPFVKMAIDEERLAVHALFYNPANCAMQLLQNSSFVPFSG